MFTLAIVSGIVLQIGAIAVGAIILYSPEVLAHAIVKQKAMNETQEKIYQHRGKSIPISGTSERDIDDIRHNFRIVIDPGHGGKDGGVQGPNGTRESEVVLQISHILRVELEARGAHVVMTRDNEERLADSNARHKQRSDILNRHEIIEQTQPDLVVSIHLNSFPAQRTVKGLQVFYQKGSAKNVNIGKNFAHAIQTKINAEDLFTKKRNAMPGDYLILETAYPSVLVECGFLSNPEEEQKLVNEKYQKKLARHIADAIIETLEIGENYLF